MAFYNFRYWMKPSPPRYTPASQLTANIHWMQLSNLVHHVLARGYGLSRMRLQFPLAACEEFGTTLRDDWMVLFYFQVVCENGYGYN